MTWGMFMPLFFRRFFVIFFIVQMVVHQAQATRALSFSNASLDFYKKLNTTHELADFATQFKKNNQNMPYLIEKIKSSKNQPLPKVKLSAGHIYFLVEGKSYKLSYLKQNQYLIDGQVIDLSKDLAQQFETAWQPTDLLIQRAHAIAPLFWMAVIIVTAVAGSAVCINSSVSDNLFNKNEITAKWLKAGSLNRYMRELKNKLKPMCPGAAWAQSDAANNFDYEQFFKSYCSRLASRNTNISAIISSGFNEEVASPLLQNTDEADRALIQAATADVQFMEVCLKTKTQIIDQNPTPGTER
jgi:hypothetical protein